MKYQATIDLSQKNNSHTLAYRMVQDHAQGRSLRVLEVGCATGYWGRALKEAGHFVAGVEPDEPAAELAREVLDEVFVGTSDDYFLAHPEKRFDIISFVDVLEHTQDPQRVLRESRQHLSAGGAVVISVPNVAHLAVRTMLMAGRWDYARTGIMDDGHVRFFTRDSLIDLLTAAEFRIFALEPTRMSAKNVEREYGIHSPPGLRFFAALLASDRNFLDFQYIVCAQPADSLMASGAAANAEFRGNSGRWSCRLFKAECLLKACIVSIRQTIFPRA